LIDIGESVKHMNIVVVAEAFLFKMKGKLIRVRDPMLAQVNCRVLLLCRSQHSARDRCAGVLSTIDRQVRRVPRVDTQQQASDVQLRRDARAVAGRTCRAGSVVLCVVNCCEIA